MSTDRWLAQLEKFAEEIQTLPALLEPFKLFLKVRSQVLALRLQDHPETLTQDEKLLARWKAVYEAHEEGGSWAEARETASKRLAGTGFAAPPRTMKYAYEEVQFIHHNGYRRPRKKTTKHS